MNKIHSIFILLFTCFLISGCEKKQLKDLTQIGYGTSFGMCMGYCRNSLSITASKLTLTRTTNDGRQPQRECTKNFTAKEFEDLKALLASAKITTLPDVTGCPDCADGGAEWIAANVDGKDYKITFEYGSPPKELEAVVLRLSALKEGFKDCE